MAVATGGEFLVNSLWMGMTMALHAAFNGFVFSRMTFCAEKGGMFGVTFDQQLSDLAMTVGADLFRGSIGIADFECLMRWMTGKTFCKWAGAFFHGPRLRGRSGMILVTLVTVRYVAVLGMMTGGAVEIGVSGRKGFHLLVPFGVADEASL